MFLESFAELEFCVLNNGTGTGQATSPAPPSAVVSFQPTQPEMGWNPTQEEMR